MGSYQRGGTFSLLLCPIATTELGKLPKLVGIVKDFLSEIENGKKKASIDLLQKYADLFGLRPSTLLRFSEDYEEAYNNNAAQAFITSLMSKLINSYAIGSQVDSSD